MHTPPTLEKFVHPSAEHVFAYFLQSYIPPTPTFILFLEDCCFFVGEDLFRVEVWSPGPAAFIRPFSLALALALAAAAAAALALALALAFAVWLDL